MRILTASLALLLALLGIPAQAESLFRSDFTTWDYRWQIDGKRHNVWVKDGMLVLGLARDSDGLLRQARVDTEDSWQFTFGTVRFRMRFRGPMGGHAAGWLTGPPVLGVGQSEVDVVEHMGRPKVWHVVHWCPCPDWPSTQSSKTVVELDPEVWHIYAVTWSPTEYVFSVDGVVTARVLNGLSVLPHYLVLSYLVSPWERKHLDREHLGKYRAYIDWVEVTG